MGAKGSAPRHETQVRRDPLSTAVAVSHDTAGIRLRIGTARLCGSTRDPQLCCRVVHGRLPRLGAGSVTRTGITGPPDRQGESMSVYRVTEVIGVSEESWEDAAREAVKTAAGTVRDLRVAEVIRKDVTIENGQVKNFRVRLGLSFKYDTAD